MGLKIGKRKFGTSAFVVACLIALAVLAGAFAYLNHSSQSQLASPAGPSIGSADIGHAKSGDQKQSPSTGLQQDDPAPSNAKSAAVPSDIRKSIAERAKDTDAVVLLQQTLVNALLEQGKYDEALREAKGYYNVAPLTGTADAVELVASALSMASPVMTSPGVASPAMTAPPTTSPELVAEFQTQQLNGALLSADAASQPSVLSNIHLDGSAYRSEIEKSQSADTYDTLIGRGNLLLLADRAKEAQDTFIIACKSCGKKTNDKRFFAAFEGVARAIRAHDGIAGPANAMILALMVGKADGTHSMGGVFPGEVFPGGIWENGELQVAGQHAALAQLSKAEPISASVTTAAKDATNGTVFPGNSLTAENSDLATGLATSGLYDLRDPLIVASLALDRDPQLVAWLQSWRDSHPPGGKPVLVTDQQRSQLASVLQRTQLPCVLLFQIGHAFQFATRDYATAALFYETGADRSEAELDAGDAERRLAIVRSIKDHIGGFRRVLWTVGHDDRAAVKGLYQLYSNYIHWAPASDVSLSKHAVEFTVSASECLNYQGLSDDAITILSSLTDKQIDDGKLRSSVDYQYGEALYRSDRCSEAIPRLQSAAKSPRYAKFALPHLCDAMFQLGRASEASRVYDEWVRTCNPPQAEADRLAAKIRQ